MVRFKKDAAAQKDLANTVKLSDMRSEGFDTIFFVGGHGPMWDIVDNPDAISLIESFYNSGKPVVAVCHSSAVFHRVMINGVPLMKGRRVTGFTNGEEDYMQLTKVVPFLVEDELMRVGAVFEKVANFLPLTVVDGRVLSGQNPASSGKTAQSLLDYMKVANAA
jgi:putative intracellular protease/amidase